MEYQQKILLLVTGVLVVFALYLALTMTSPGEADTKAAEALLMKAMGFGSDAKDYSYVFTEVMDDYKTTYTIARNGNESTVEVENPLSVKKAYFLNNDTILCISYPKGGNNICSTVQGMDDTQLYMKSLKANLLSDAMVSINTGNMKYLIAKGYAKPSPDMTNGSVGGKQCKWLSYVVDMSGLTLDEAARFGISTTSPKVFSWRMCVDDAAGYIYEKNFNYSFQNLQHIYDYKLDSYQPNGAGPITAPENVNEGAVKVLFNEREQQSKLAICYINQRGAERENCIADIALVNRNKAICELAGSTRDRCLVALVPLTKDITICPTIISPSFTDDCYIELGGALKNSTWCGSIQNQSKVGFCMNVSKPKEAGSAPGIDIDKFLNYVDKTNDTTNNTANGTGE